MQELGVRVKQSEDLTKYIFNSLESHPYGSNKAFWS